VGADRKLRSKRSPFPFGGLVIYTMLFSVRNAFYLRISKNTVLPTYVCAPLEMACLSIHPLVDLLGRKASPLDVRTDPSARSFRYETTVGPLLVSRFSVKVLKPRSLLSKLKAEANIVLSGNTAKKAVDTHRGGISISPMHTFIFSQFL